MTLIGRNSATAVAFKALWKIFNELKVREYLYFNSVRMLALLPLVQYLQVKAVSNPNSLI